MLGGETQYLFAQRLAGELRGAAGDDSAGAAIGAGVVAAIVGVGAAARWMLSIVVPSTVAAIC